MRRRNFLRECGRAALGFGLLPSVVRAQSRKKPFELRRPPSTEEMIGEVEKLVPKLIRDTVVPGIALAIVQGGKLVWTRGFGVRDSASKEPVDNDTVFEAASVSKTVFAYAVMKLCEKGILNLDTPLTKYAPRPFLEGEPRLNLITARHVLSHTTGFKDWRSKTDPLKIHFTPGSQFDYSGEGYFYLQSIVSHLIGRVHAEPCGRYEAGLEVCATNFDEMMKQILLRPLGMASSSYLWSDSMWPHAARAHGTEGNVLPQGKPAAPDVARYGAAGGLLTTATDFAKFLLEVIAPKPSDAFRLTPPSLKEMLRPQIKLAKGQEIDGASAWALGWAIQERPTGNVILHSGGQTGFRSLTMASVERKSGFVILTNGDNGGKVCYDLTLGTLLTPLLAG
jgi:CubicO group peptidase (beta-lactamase class C family)